MYHPGHPVLINTPTFIITVQFSEWFEGTCKIQVLVNTATHTQHWLLVNLQYMSPRITEINLGGFIATNENIRITIMMVVSHIFTMYLTR